MARRRSRSPKYAVADLATLPEAIGEWEVATGPSPVDVPGVEGLVIVAEAPSGNARCVGMCGAALPLWNAIAPAFFAPAAPGAPARPRAIRCADPALAKELAAALEGTGVAVRRVDRVPLAQAVLDAMTAHLRPYEAPGIAIEPERWSEAIAAIARAEPWRHVSEHVLFRFEVRGREAEPVAVVMGDAGIQRGIALYATEGARDAFVAAAERRLRRDPALSGLCVWLDDARDFTPDERARCASLGLVGPLLPRVIGIRGGEPFPLDEDTERALLGFTEAMAAACGDLPGVLDGEAIQADTIIGTIRVSATPRADASDPAERDLPILADGDHGVAVGTLRDPAARKPVDRPAVVVKMRKAEANRLARRLAGVDGFRLLVGDEGLFPVMLCGEDEIGVLTQVTGASPDRARDLTSTPELIVVVSAGGPTRQHIDPAEFVYVKTLRRVP